MRIGLDRTEVADYLSNFTSPRLLNAKADPGRGGPGEGVRCGLWSLCGLRGSVVGIIQCRMAQRAIVKAFGVVGGLCGAQLWASMGSMA